MSWDHKKIFVVFFNHLHWQHCNVKLSLQHVCEFINFCKYTDKISCLKIDVLPPFSYAIGCLPKPNHIPPLTPSFPPVNSRPHQEQRVFVDLILLKYYPDFYMIHTTLCKLKMESSIKYQILKCTNLLRHKYLFHSFLLQDITGTQIVLLQR